MRGKIKIQKKQGRGHKERQRAALLQTGPQTQAHRMISFSASEEGAAARMKAVQRWHRRQDIGTADLSAAGCPTGTPAP